MSRERALPLVILALALLLGAYARFNIVRTDFPYGDGGMFYVMIQDLRANHYVLPQTTTYNDRNIPYAYPPLGFYLGAALSDVTGIDPMDLIRVLPVLFNLLTIPAIYLLATHFLKTRTQAAVAALVYAVLPVSFEWQIMGGGLTRSLGYLLAILTMEQAYRMYTTRERRTVVSTMVLGALSVLAHAQMGQFAAVGVGTIFLFRGLNRAGIIHSIVVAVGVIALTFPWWGAVIGYHGVTPFRQAFAAASPIAQISDGALEVDDPEFPMVTRIDTFLGEEMRYLNFIPILGLVYLILERRWLLPAWFILNLLLAPRGAAARTGVMTGMFVAVVALEIVPLVWAWVQKHLKSSPSDERDTAPEIAADVHKADEATAQSASDPRSLSSRRGLAGEVQRFKPLLIVAITAILSLYAFTSSRNFPPLPGYYRFYSLSQAEQTAMRWIATYTLPSCRFLTLGPLSPWGRDAIGEWFPVLADRMSVATVQGTEWLTNPHQNQVQSWHATLNACGSRDASCLEHWRQEFGLDFTHVYIEAPARTECCSTLRRTLRESPDYSLLYSRDGVDIFARRASICPAGN